MILLHPLEDYYCFIYQPQMSARDLYLNATWQSYPLHVISTSACECTGPQVLISEIRVGYFIFQYISIVKGIRGDNAKVQTNYHYIQLVCETVYPQTNSKQTQFEEK